MTLARREGLFSYHSIEKKRVPKRRKERKCMSNKEKSRIDSVSGSAETETPVYALGNSR
jgi:hypothetical protein